MMVVVKQDERRLSCIKSSKSDWCCDFAVVLRFWTKSTRLTEPCDSIVT